MPQDTLSADVRADHPMLADVLRGLRSTPKSLPSKYFYDERGSLLFDEITELDAYYPTRIERGIMVENIDEMAEAIGRGSVLIEYGSGSSEKTELLLDALPDLAYYIPIDISAAHLEASAERLRARYPGLSVRPVAADYTRPFTLPEDPEQRRKRVVYFPGSTIGNFTPAEARHFLERIAGLIGKEGGLLLGVDRKKNPEILERAYDDPEGVTAAFNKNILWRINSELSADFDVGAFSHRAFYNDREGRVEMHLVSDRDQTVLLNGEAIRFQEGESIHTENSYKYDVEDLVALARPARLTIDHEWTDSNQWFSVLYFTCDERS